MPLLASRWASSSKRNQCSSCSGCMAPAPTVQQGCYHLGSTSSDLGGVDLIRDLVLLEATPSVSTFRFPCYYSIKSPVGSWVFDGCGDMVSQPKKLRDLLPIQRQSSCAICATQFCFFSLAVLGFIEIINLRTTSIWDFHSSIHCQTLRTDPLFHILSIWSTESVPVSQDKLTARRPFPVSTSSFFHVCRTLCSAFSTVAYPVNVCFLWWSTTGLLILCHIRPPGVMEFTAVPKYQILPHIFISCEISLWEQDCQLKTSSWHYKYKYSNWSHHFQCSVSMFILPFQPVVPHLSSVLSYILDFILCNSLSLIL